MTFAIANTTHTLGSSVADDGTVTVAYPAGFVQADLTGSTGGEVVVDNNDVWPQSLDGADGTVTFTFGASNITVTNKTTVAWAAGSTLIISFGSKDLQDDPDMGAVQRQIDALDARITALEGAP